MRRRPLLDGAVDAALFHASAAEEQAWLADALRDSIARPAIRVWIYSRTAVVLGRSAWEDAASAARARAAGVELCVRPSGGGAVLAGPWMMSASVVLPTAHPLAQPGIARSYAWLGSVHCDWLERVGITAHPATRPVVRRDDALAWACFAGLSYGEIAIRGRKMIGLSQARRRNAVLYSSGILLSPPPWEVLCDVAGQPREQALTLSNRTLAYSELAESVALPTALGESLLGTLCSALVIGHSGHDQSNVAGIGDSAPVSAELGRLCQSA